MRIRHSLPAQLVAELDQVIVARRLRDHWTRSEVVAIAIRRFLDQGGLSLVLGTDPFPREKQLRRRLVQFHFPPDLIRAYQDQIVAGRAHGEYRGEWELVAVAIRRFLDQGVMGTLTRN